MDIRNWLQGNRDYEQGRALYEKYSPNPVLKGVFALGPGPYNTKKLASELEKLQEPEPTPAPAAGNDTHVATSNTATETVLQQLRPLLAEQAAIHAQLDMPQTDTERFARAHRVMELADKIEPLWDAYYYAKEHGKLPELEVKPLPTTEADQLRRLTNLRTYRTRYADRPDKLPAIVAEIKQLEELLNGKK